MKDASITLVLQVKPDAQANSILSDYAQECARWLNANFRMLYADKRNHGWSEFKDLVTEKKRGGFLVNRKMTWELMGKNDSIGRKRIPTRIAHAKNLQGLATQVGQTWGNFIGSSKNRKIPRPKGHLPVFHPIAHYNNQMIKVEKIGAQVTLRAPHPFIQKTWISIPLVTSNHNSWKNRIDLLMADIGARGEKNTPSMEFKRHKDGKWYVHIPITPHLDRPAQKENMVYGVDVGERNSAAMAHTSDGANVVKDTIHPAMALRHQLDRHHARKRQLRSKVDTGNRKARKKLRELKGKERNIRNLQSHVMSRRIVDEALAGGASTIALEDLRGGFSKIKGGKRAKRTNRRNFAWARGEDRDKIMYKAGMAGIRVVEVYPRGTSSTCPVCGVKDRKARSRAKDLFKCKTCGFIENDDIVGAMNIAQRGYKYITAKSRSLSPAAGVRREDNRGISPPVGECCNPHRMQEASHPVIVGRDCQGKPTTGTGLRANNLSVDGSSDRITRPARG